MNILLLEDDKQLNQAITRFLTLKGFEVSSFYDGNHVLEEVGNYDLYLLDINTPNVNGLEILQYISGVSNNAKVIMISADIAIETIKHAYDKGCYDYLKKPFQIEELFLKINNLAQLFDKKVSLSNGLVFDMKEKILYKENIQIELTKKETLLINLLVQNHPNIVTFEEIEFSVYNNETTALATVRALVKRIREKIGKENITTIINIGYKM